MGELRSENSENHSNSDFISWRVQPGIVSRNVLHVGAVFHPNCLQFPLICSNREVLPQMSSLNIQ